MTITLTAGYTFTDDELIVSAKLNQLLAAATIALAGTLDTSQITDGAVTAAKAKVGPWFWGTGAGTAGAHTVTLSPAITSYETGTVIRYVAPATNTGAVTVDVSGLGAQSILKPVVGALDPGDIRSGQVVEIVYDGTNFQLLSADGNPAIYVGQDAGTTSAYAITPSPALAQYFTGLTVMFKANTQSDGNATLNVSALGAKALKKNKDSALAAADIKAGQWVLAVYDGTNFQVQVPSSNVQPSVVGDTRNLVIKRNATNPAFQLDVDADEIVLKDSSGGGYLAQAVDLTLDLSVNGANGLDTGGEAASTWYHVWVIFNGTTVAGLFSTSSTAPTLPTDYTHKALVGVVRNNSGSNIRPMWQVGRDVFVEVQQLFTAKGPAAGNTYEALSGADLTTFQDLVPPTARTARGTFGSSNAQGAKITVAGDANGTGAVTCTQDAAGTSWDSFGAGAPFEVPLMTSQNFYWKSLDTSARSRITISGFRI